jgi:hypothetical protein
MLWQVFEQMTETLITFQLIYDCIKGRLWVLIYLLWWWMRSQEIYKLVSLGVCSLQVMWFWWMRVGRGLTRSWNCGDEFWRQNVLVLVGLKHSIWSVISVLRGGGGDVRLGGQVVSKKHIFRYFGSMLQKDGDINEDVSHRIKIDWLKWRQASSVLCSPKVRLKLKCKFYRIVFRSVMLYGV